MPTENNNFFPPHEMMRKRIRDNDALGDATSSSADADARNNGNRVNEKILWLKKIKEVADLGGLDFLPRDFLSDTFVATPLAEAVLSDDSKKFAEQFPEKEKGNLPAWLNFACASGSQAVVEQLIKLMNEAIKNKLLSETFLPSEQHDNPLYFAAAGGNKALCDWLVETFHCRYNLEIVSAIGFGGAKNRKKFQNEIRGVHDHADIPSIHRSASLGYKR